ncbi:MAG TPA: response regulator [Terriglobales bacterium]|nr:response regulator [Terriglobales bacterium]
MRKLLIHIVDDEINVARTLQMVLEREDYVVTCASSARAAYAQYRDGFRPDAAIIDLNMEREDIGLEVAAAAQRLKPCPIIIICTGYANVDNIQTALDLRVDYLATKPVDLEELKGALRRLLVRRSSALRLEKTKTAKVAGKKTKTKARSKRAGARG